MATAKLEFTILQQTEHAFRYEDEENGREVLHGAPAEVLNACEWRPLGDQCVEWVTNHAEQDTMSKVVLLRHLVALKILPQHSVPDRWMTDVWHRVADWLVAGSTIWKSQCKASHLCILYYEKCHIQTARRSQVLGRTERYATILRHPRVRVAKDFIFIYHLRGP